MTAFELDHSPLLTEFVSGDYTPKPKSLKIRDRAGFRSHALAWACRED
jgi:hypothetical protein